MYREKSINTSRRKLKERPNSTVILLCITLTSQFKTRIVAGHVYILEWQSYAGIIRVTFQRAPNTITQLPEINFYRAAPHNESVVAHALSESWCETAVAKLKGKQQPTISSSRRLIIDLFCCLVCMLSNPRPRILRLSINPLL